MEVKLALNSLGSSYLVQGFQAYTTMPCYVSVDVFKSPISICVLMKFEV